MVRYRASAATFTGVGMQRKGKVELTSYLSPKALSPEPYASINDHE